MKNIIARFALTVLLGSAITPVLKAEDRADSRPAGASVISFNAVSYEDHLIECVCNLRNAAGKDYEIYRFVPPPSGTRGPAPDAYTQMSTCSNACNQLVLARS